MYVKRDFSMLTISRFLIQSGILFVMPLVVGFLLVRWYYRQKDK